MSEVTLREYLEQYVKEHTNLHALEHLAVKEAMDASERRASVALGGVEHTNEVHRKAHIAEHQAHSDVHAVQKENIDKADHSLDKRLYAMNEWREAQRHLVTTMLSRSEAEARFDSMAEKLDRASQASGRMISRDVFDGAQEAILRRLDESTAAGAQLSEQVSNARARAAAYNIALAALFSVLTLIIMAFGVLSK